MSCEEGQHERHTWASAAALFRIGCLLSWQAAHDSLGVAKMRTASGVIPSQQLHTGSHNNGHRFKTAASAPRLFLHTVFCIASVVLGFRISQEASLVVLQFSDVELDTVGLNRNSDLTTAAATDHGTVPAFDSDDAVLVRDSTVDRLPHPDARLPAAPVSNNWSKSNSPRNATGVQVGRHRILIRKWPHPDPTDTMKAYNLIAKVQQEQEQLHGVRDWKPIIAITPTFARMFQALHLTGLMHTLSLVRGPVTWIVVEAGRASNGTAALLAQARVHNVVHLGYPKPMPPDFEARWILESHLRVEGLRFVREKKLEGVVVFADDSNVHSLKFFDLVQTVNWVGVVPVGILGYAGFQDGTSNTKRRRRRRGSLLLGVVHKGQAAPKIDLQVQALAHGNGTTLHGWHAHRPLPLDWDSGKGTTVLDNGLQWAGFVMNARAVWASEIARPHWLKEWNAWTRLKEGVYLDLRSIFKDESRVEEVPDWGRNKVRHWWIRMEGRPDCRFPSRWALDSQPNIVLPARSTPWLEGTAPNSTSNSHTSLLPSSQTKRSSSRNKLPVAREGKLKAKPLETSSQKSTVT